MKKLLYFLLFNFSLIISAQELSEGPFSQLIIRGATLINGNGAPPVGPVDIVIEQDKIVKIKSVGYPGIKINPLRRPKLKTAVRKLMPQKCMCYLDLLICMDI